MQKLYARWFGVVFILSFISYALGMGLMDVLQDSKMHPQELLNQEWKLKWGFILCAVVHTGCNLGLLSIMVTLLRGNYAVLASFYGSCGLVSTVLLALGAAVLVLPFEIVREAQEVVEGNANQGVLLWTGLAVKMNFYLYQTGMTIWGIGGLSLAYGFWQYRLVPRVFPLWAVVGYLAFLIGTLLEFFNYPVGVWLSIPGGLFELALSVWVIFKGFNTTMNPPDGLAGIKI